MNAKGIASSSKAKRLMKSRHGISARFPWPDSSVTKKRTGGRRLAQHGNGDVDKVELWVAEVAVFGTSR